MKLTLYEQSAFTVEYNGKKIAIDVGSLTSPGSLTVIGQPDAAVVSHIHKDHFDQANLRSLMCPVYTVEEVITAAEDTQVFHVVAAGESVTFPDTGISAYFGKSDHGPNVGPVEQVSMIIETGDGAIAFAADMYNPTPLPALPFSALLIPIGNNGFTFDSVAAAEYVKSISFTGTIIPIHFRRFDNSEEILASFKNEIGTQAKVHVLEVGDSIDLG